MQYTESKRTRAALAKALAALMLLEGAFGFFVPDTGAAVQNSWRWRNDDGTEATATWKAAEGEPVSGIDKEVVQRLRFGVAADGASSEMAREKLTDLIPSGAEAFRYGALIDDAAGYAYFPTFANPKYNFLPIIEHTNNNRATSVTPAPP